MILIRQRLRSTALVAACGLGCVSVGGSVAATTESTPMDTFEIPAERITALQDAGLGWLVDGVEYPDQPAGVPWPTEEWSRADELPAGADAVALQAAIDAAFTSPDGSGTVDAVIAVQGGQLVVEEYNGWDPEAPHLSWSMAKSITHAMLGILVAEGRVDVWAPAPVPEWSDPADPRHAITIDDLLHMRSGLEWQEEYVGFSDVAELLAGDARANRAQFAADRPLVDDPGTHFYYSSGTTQILSRVVADQVGYGEQGTAWAREALFDRLGIGEVVHDLDGIGVISGSSTIDMTPLDYARFGLLYVRGGSWDGDQILPEAWVDYARLPLPDAPEYGAHWWTFGSENGNHGAFQANGFAGQTITVVPELDLVVVVLANEQGPRPDLIAAAVVNAFADVGA